MTLAAPKADSVPIESLLPQRSLKIKDGILRAQLIGLMAQQGEILPSANSPLGRLWQLVHSDESTVEQCVDIIQLDPSLASRVFRIANSGAYQGKAPNLKDAVIFLGFSKLRQVVFSAGIFEQFCKMKLPEKWNHFWIRNVLISRLAECISADFFRTTGSEYLAGLLHDSGWILNASFFPAEVDRVLVSTKPIHEAELEIFSFNHGDVSAMGCARSHLPARVVHAVQQHQAPDLSPLPKAELPRTSSRLLGIILHVCDRLATSANMPLIEGDSCTLPDVVASPEYQWLVQHGLKADLKLLLQEEIPKAREVYSIFFR